MFHLNTRAIFENVGREEKVLNACIPGVDINNVVTDCSCKLHTQYSNTCTG